MNAQTILLYDGSFDGFLSCVFVAYDQKITSPVIRKEYQTNNQLFTINETIITNRQKANRVWEGFKSRTKPNEQRGFFKAFLSEIKGVENTLFSYMRTIFSNPINQHIDFGNKDILKITQVAKMVDREKHRMEAFVRFQLTKDDIYTSTVSPDFNVLPLIVKHFKDRYADQKWLIYDTNRKYCIFYDLTSVEIITLEEPAKILPNQIQNIYKKQEVDFQKLWSTYYNSVNIKSRKNTKLHVQHLPKRYWKYLTEKNIRE